MKATKNLTEGNVYKNLLLYTIPLILSSLLSLSYSTVDGMIAGKCIGEFAMGAISATSSFNVLINALFVGISEGFAIYVSQLFGKGSYASIKQSIVSMTCLVALISVTLSGLVIALRDPILDYLNVDPILREDAERYFIISVVSYVVCYVNMFWVRSLHALGITSFSLYVSLMSALLNVGGNLLAVMVFGMGVEGLAISSLGSALVASVVYIVMLRGAFREMPSEPISYRYGFSVVRRSIGYTLPLAVQKMAILGVSLVLAPSINALGAAATAGYGVSQQLYNIGTMSLWAATSAFSCYTGQCVGEGNTKKIRRGLPCGFVINAALMLPVVLSISFFAGPIVSIFFPDGYVGDAYFYAFRYARIYAPLIYVQLVDHMFHAYIRGLGRITVVLGSTLVGSLVRIALTFPLISLMHIEGVYLAEVISWGVDALICFALYVWCYRTDAHLERILACRKLS